MSQVTKDFVEIMLKHADKLEHSPLTVNEEKQLALAWLDRNLALEAAKPLMEFYHVDLLSELIEAQNRHIEKLQAKLVDITSRYRVLETPIKKVRT